MFEMSVMPLLHQRHHYPMYHHHQFQNSVPCICPINMVITYTFSFYSKIFKILPFTAERAPPRPPLPREGLAPQRPPPPETDDEDEGVFRTMPHANQPILVRIYKVLK